MSKERDICVELQARIRADINAFDGHLPERYVIAWNAYLAALMEWKVIEFSVYSKLLDLLPPIAEPDPIATIFAGRE